MRKKHNPFTTVTPLSKAVALALFVSLPFIGAYFGYSYATGLCEAKYSALIKKTKKPITIVRKRIIPIKENSQADKLLKTVQASDEEKTINAGGTKMGNAYSIKILPGWQVNQEQIYNNGQLVNDHLEITLKSDSVYKISILQSPTAQTRCKYSTDGDTAEDGDILYYNYVKIKDLGNNAYRRAKEDSTLLTTQGTSTYNLCQYIEIEEGNGNFYMPTTHDELIRYQVIENTDESILEQMDDMISSRQFADIK